MAASQVIRIFSSLRSWPQEYLMRCWLSRQQVEQRRLVRQKPRTDRRRVCGLNRLQALSSSILRYLFSAIVDLLANVGDSQLSSTRTLPARNSFEAAKAKSILLTFVTGGRGPTNFRYIPAIGRVDWCITTQKPKPVIFWCQRHRIRSIHVNHTNGRVIRKHMAYARSSG